MKINTKKVFNDFKGEEMKDEKNEVFTLGRVVSNVLAGRVADPYKGYLLGKLFATQEEVEVKVEDVAFIKKELIENGKNPQGGYNAIVIGQAIEMIEAPEEVK